MTKHELRRLVDECCQRFDSVRARFAQDDRRAAGDNSTRLVVCWWEAMQDLELVDCLDVVREIFTGKIPRPYPSDFPGTIASEIRKRKAERSSYRSGNFTELAEKYRREAEATREADRELEAEQGPVLDSMNTQEQRQFANSICTKARR